MTPPRREGPDLVCCCGSVQAKLRPRQRRRHQALLPPGYRGERGGGAGDLLAAGGQTRRV